MNPDISFSGTGPQLSISGLGLTLERLREEHIEQVRKWRNHPSIRDKMVFRDEISKEDQIKWFQSLNPEKAYYFVIFVNKEFAGLTELKKVDPTNLSAESGIFIIPKFQKSDVGIRASINLFDFGFSELGLTTFHSQVLKENKHALKFNYFLGHKAIGESDHLIYMQMTKDDYDKSMYRMRKILQKTTIQQSDFE